MRVARASVAGSLFFSFGLGPALAHMAAFPRGGPSGRPGIAFAHGHAFGAHGLNRNSMNRNGANRFVFDGRGRFVRAGFKRVGSNFNQGAAFGCCGWGSWGGWAGPVATTPDAPIVVGGGPSVVINLPPNNAYAGAGEGAGGHGGGCVIHKLQFDSAGKYTSEQQYTEC
jgi:hypothetical protein